MFVVSPQGADILKNARIRTIDASAAPAIGQPIEGPMRSAKETSRVKRQLYDNNHLIDFVYKMTTNTYSSRSVLPAFLLLGLVCLTHVLSAPQQPVDQSIGRLVPAENDLNNPDSLPTYQLDTDLSKRERATFLQSKNTAVDIESTTRPTPSTSTSTTVKPDPPPKGSSSSILFGVVVAVVLLMLGCLLYFMFFGSQKESTESIARPNEDSLPIIQAKKSSAASKSPLPADPQLTVRSTTGVPSQISLPTPPQPPAAAGQQQNVGPQPVAPQSGVPQQVSPQPTAGGSSSKISGLKSTKSILKPRKSKA